MGQRTLHQPLLLLQTPHRQGQRHVTARDRRRTRSPIRLEHITINPYRPRPQLPQIHHRTQRASNQPLDLLRTAINATPGTVPGFALQRGIRQHRILRRDPPARHTLLLHPPRHAFLDRHPADDPRASPLNQGRACGMGRDAIVKIQRPQLVRTPAVPAWRWLRRGHGWGIGRFSPAHRGQTNAHPSPSLAESQGFFASNPSNNVSMLLRAGAAAGGFRTWRR